MDKTDIKSLVKKTPEQEKKEAVAMYDEIESLTDIMQKIEQLRKEVVLEARRSDIGYVRKIDIILETVLETLTENKDMLSKAVVESLRKASMKDLRELMVAMGVAIDKREMLLGFDETRRMRKRKMNLRVIFKGPNGTQAGVSVEQEG